MTEDLRHYIRLIESAGTPQFADWFDGSHVVDRNGKPLKMYHGTRAQFTRFDPAFYMSGSNDGIDDELGFYFTSRKRMASRYARDGRIVVAYLRVTNPYLVTANQWGNAEGLSPREARDQGYDGYCIRGQEGGVTWIVFDDSAIWQVEGLHEAHEGGVGFDAEAVADEVLSEIRQGVVTSDDEYVENFEDNYDGSLPSNFSFNPMAFAPYRQWLNTYLTTEAVEWYNSLHSMVSGGVVKCWRAIVAPDDWQPNQRHLGTSWTYTKKKAIPYDYRDDTHLYVIEADIPEQSIDWETTVLHHMTCDQDEDEITIFDETPVNVVKITKRPFGGPWWD